MRAIPMWYLDYSRERMSLARPALRVTRARSRDSYSCRNCDIRLRMLDSINALNARDQARNIEEKFPTTCSYWRTLNPHVESNIFWQLRSFCLLMMAIPRGQKRRDLVAPCEFLKEFLNLLTVSLSFMK